MPTIKDVAREAGVSIATVSYVLNNKDSFVSEETRQQVLATARRIGYRPNIIARSLQSNRTQLIGYSWHEVPKDQTMNSVMDTFTYYLAQAAEDAGYHVLTFTHPHGHPIPSYTELMQTGRVDAFVLAGTIAHDARIGHLLAVDFPFVSFGRSNLEWDFHWVDTDGRRGVYAAVQYLIELGHRRIAMAAWPEESISGSFRLAGYLDALKEAGIPIHPGYIIRGEHSEEAGRAAMASWRQLLDEERPTAVIGVSDLVALGVMFDALEHGLEIGAALSVVGFDDSPMSRYVRPALTTVQQPIPEIAQALMRMVEPVLENRPVNPDHVLLAPRLVIRGSCGPAGP